jgi:hypothetical protein
VVDATEKAFRVVRKRKLYPDRDELVMGNNNQQTTAFMELKYSSSRAPGPDPEFTKALNIRKKSNS